MLARLTDAEIERARAVPLARLIGADVALKRAGREFVGLCPFHGEKSPSFFVVPERGFYHCFGCGAHGTAIDYVMRTRGLDFPAAVRELIGASPDDVIPNLRPPARPAAVSLPADGPDPLVLDLWRSAKADRLVAFYLQSRGLSPGRFQAALRGHYEVWCAESLRARPAILAAVQDSAGEICGLQRIWVERRYDVSEKGLPPKGARATDLAAGKKTLGHLRDGAVRLFDPAHGMGIAEGVETALAAAERFCVPVWASCGGARMGSVRMPPECGRLTIYGDNGTNGRELAERAAEAHRARGIKVSVEYPPEQWGDWCDVVRAEAC